MEMNGKVNIHCDDNPEPDYLRDYLYDYWSEGTRKSLITSVCKALYIKIQNLNI